MKTNCKQCRRAFTTTLSRIEQGKGKFCSKTCYTLYQNEQGITNIVNHHCVVCHKGMRLTPYLRRMKIKCCSIKCQHELQKKRIHKTCPTCHKKFESRPFERRKFCNKKCKETQFTRELKCEQCYKTFTANVRKRKRKCKYYFCSNKCKFEWSKGKPHPKMSEWMGKNIANGSFIPMAQNYKQGYIINKSTGNKEFYASSYEKHRMQQLNKQHIPWTKKHRIKLQYVDDNGTNRNYVPDILVNRQTIEEIKPKRLLKKNNNPQKFAVAMRYCTKNNLQFEVLTEKELGI